MELAYKRRLRDRKRSIATTLEAQGYRVRTFEDGPFHLFACKGKTARAIRISFGYVHYDEPRMISGEPVPERCIRELWKISDDGRSIVITRVHNLSE